MGRDARPDDFEDGKITHAPRFECMTQQPTTGQVFVPSLLCRKRSHLRRLCQRYIP